jgi:hypothetical protein
MSGDVGDVRVWRRARARARPLRHCDGGCRVSALACASACPAPHRTAPLRALCCREHALGPRQPALTPTAHRRCGTPRAVYVFISVTALQQPAIVARCKEAATVNPCVSAVAYVLRMAIDAGNDFPQANDAAEWHSE